MNINSHNSKPAVIAQFSEAIVIGLGLTGFSVVRYLSARGLKVSVFDSRKEPTLTSQLLSDFPDVELNLGSFEKMNLTIDSLIVVSPGISLTEPFLLKAKSLGATIVGDIELFIQENTQPIIAITGSNGKSTVTTLVGKMCESGGKKTLVAGNIGLPVLDALTDKNDYEVAVLELSSFQLETTSQISAKSVAILNISADHLDRYPSMGDYILAKTRILRGAENIVLPKHDELLDQITHKEGVLKFTLSEPANDSEYGIKRVSNNRWLLKGERRLIELRDIPLLGLHNISNVLAAYALVEFLKFSEKSKAAAVKSFTGLAHRMQTVCFDKDITWINDSKATNVGATSTALLSLEQDVFWIAGGQGKGADFTELKNSLKKNIKVLILMGEDADQIESALSNLIPIERVENMHDAVGVAGEKAVIGSVVLFSPACASFDMYQNFERRGEDFANEVQAWVDRGAA